MLKPKGPVEAENVPSRRKSSVELGICNWSHPSLRSPACCAGVKEMGVQAVQLGLDEGEEPFSLMSEAVRRRWKEEAGRVGLRLASISARAVLRHGMTAEAGSAQRAKAEEAVAAALNVAADMGVSQITLASAGASSIRNRDDLRETARCLRLACALAKQRGMSVATENALDGETLRTLFRIVGYDNLRLLLDLAAYGGSGCATTPEAFSGFSEVCAGAHVKDVMYGRPRPLGEGLARVGEHVGALRRRGCGGTFFLENDYTAPAFGPDPWAAIRRDVAYMISTEG